MPSYSPVFSQDFINYTPETPNTSFEVPEGFTAVVRDCTYATYVGVGWAFIGKQSSVDAPTVWFASLAVDVVYNFSQWQGRVVVEQGGYISLNITQLADDGCVYVGGYLLRNTLT